MIYTYNNKIYTYEYFHTYILTKILLQENYTYKLIQYHSNIHILIKESVHNILFFTHNYGNHIAQSLES